MKRKRRIEMPKIKNIEEIVKAAGIDIDNLYDDDGAQILLEPIYGVNREAAFAKYAKQMHDVLIVSCYLCNKKDGNEEKCKDCALCNLLGKIENEEFDKNGELKQ